MDNFAADVDKHGFSHMVTIDLKNGPKQVYYQKMAPTGSISINEMIISNVNEHCDYPDIYVDFENNVHIVWRYTWLDLTGSWCQLWYKKYNSDMSQQLISKQIAITVDTINYNSPKVVVDMNRVAYIFYDEFVDATNQWDIFYTTVDQLGNKANPIEWIDTGAVEGRDPFQYDVDISYANNVERIHVVWEEQDGGDDNIRYQSIDTNGVRTPVPPLEVAASTNQERHPSLDSQFNDGFVHIVYEDWGADGTSRENQRIRYCVIDPNGEFVRVVNHDSGDFELGPVQVGDHTDHADPSRPDARDGKFFPSVSYANNNIVTIAWKEWVNDDDSYAVYYTQRMMNHQEFYVGVTPFTSSRVIPDNEIILVTDTNDQHSDTLEHVVVVASDNRASSNDYDMDGHIRILYQQKTAMWEFKLKLVQTRELWTGIADIGYIENTERLDPDIHIDEYDDWHMVYTQRDPMNAEEVYYRTEWSQNQVPISNIDGFKSHSPKVITRQETRLGEPHEIAYIFWIDEVQPTPEIYYAAVAMAWPNPHYVFPTPNGPVRVPFLPLLPLYETIEFDIALQEIPGGNPGVIHVLFTQYTPAVGDDPAFWWISHGSLYVGPVLPSGTVLHHMTDVSDGRGGYMEPAIDIGSEGRPYVVYVDTCGARTIVYDVLQESALPWIHMDYTDPTVINTVDGHNPDIKVDRAIQRRDDTEVLNRENRFVHIVWYQGPWAGPYNIAYAKCHPIDANLDEPTEPEIAGRLIEPPGYAVMIGKGDLSLEISNDNNLAVIYSGQTMGYDVEAQNIWHQFCVFIDNNGMITSTNIQISDNNVNNEHIVHSAGGFTGNDELVVAWDKQTMVAPMSYHQTIWWRTFYWQ